MQPAQLVRLIAYLDYTTLTAVDSKEKVRRLLDRALQPVDESIRTRLAGAGDVKCAAVCVYPSRVADVKNRLSDCRRANANASMNIAAGMDEFLFTVCMCFSGWRLPERNVPHRVASARDPTVDPRRC